MASKIKVDEIETVDGTGSITVNQPLSGSGAGLTSLPAANLTGVIPAANLGTGTASSTTFLNGAGAYAAAGGGAFTLIDSFVADDVASVTLTIDTTLYTSYFIRVENVTSTTTGPSTRIRFGDAGGIDTGSSDYSWIQGRNRTDSHNHVYNGSGSVSAAIIDNWQSDLVAYNFNVNIWLNAPTASQAARPTYCYEVSEYQVDGVLSHNIGVGGRNAVMTMTQFQIYLSSGNIKTGRFTHYGIKNS